MVKLLYTKTHWYFSVKLLSSQLPSNLYWEKSIHPQVSLAFIEFYEVLVGPFLRTVEVCLKGSITPLEHHFLFWLSAAHFLPADVLLTTFILQLLCKPRGQNSLIAHSSGLINVVLRRGDTVCIYI